MISFGFIGHQQLRVLTKNIENPIMILENRENFQRRQIPSRKKSINYMVCTFIFFSYFCMLNFVETTFFKQHRLCTYFIITFCQTASEWKENHCMKIPKTSKLPNWFTLPPSEDGSYSALDDPLVKGNFFFKNNVFIKLNIHILLIV